MNQSKALEFLAAYSKEIEDAKGLKDKGQIQLKYAKQLASNVDISDVRLKHSTPYFFPIASIRRSDSSSIYDSLKYGLVGYIQSDTKNLNDMNIHIDKNIGVSGAKIHWMRSKCGKMHWCRMAIAVSGSYNMTYEEIGTMSPFDTKFNYNYVEGKGATKEEALDEMEKDMSGIADLLIAYGLCKTSV